MFKSPTIRNKLFALVILGQLLAHVSIFETQAFAGKRGADAGGGTIIQFGDKCPIMLDELELDETIREGEGCESPPPEEITSSLAIFQPQELIEMESARAQFQQWKVFFKGFHEVFGEGIADKALEALDEMTFMRTSYEFTTRRRYSVTMLENAKLYTAILYHPQYGAIVSIPKWRILGPKTRVGLVIHEVMRQLQFGQFNEMSDKQLQIITAIFASRPTLNLLVEFQKTLTASFKISASLAFGMSKYRGELFATASNVREMGDRSHRYTQALNARNATLNATLALHELYCQGLLLLKESERPICMEDSYPY